MIWEYANQYGLLEPPDAMKVEFDNSKIKC